MAKSTAAEILRAGTIENLRKKQLAVNADGKVYEFSYPEINFKDNIFEILSNAERGRSYNSETKYYLCALNEVAAGICQSESVPATEPYADFRTYGEPFIYYGGADGRIADKSKQHTRFIHPYFKVFQFLCKQMPTLFHISSL